MTEEQSIIVPSAVDSFNGCLLVVTYYGFKKPILNACQAFANEKNWVVVEFPMFRYRNDVNDKTESYIDMFCETVAKYSPDAILFWYHCFTAQEIELIQSTVNDKIAFILFNWDDPFSWYDVHGHIPSIAKYFDAALTSSRSCVPLYTIEMQKNAKRREKIGNAIAKYCLPGFDETIAQQVYEKIDDKQFVCDILFITTNLYEDEQRYNKQRINRAQIVDALYAQHVAKKIIFHIYGPEFLAKRYPLSYQGYCDYEKQYQINHTARLILNTHVVCEDGYCNERLSVALGCGSMIMSDISQPDIFQNYNPCATENICVYDLGNSVDQALDNISKVLEKSAAECSSVREKNRKLAAQHLSWNVWACILHDTIQSLSIYGNKENANKVAQKLLVKRENHCSSNSSTVVTKFGNGLTGEWDKNDFLDSLDEKELDMELNVTVFARENSELPLLVVPYERQCQLSLLITSIRNQSNPQDLKKFIEIIEANPELDINNVLEFHWCHIDKQ